MYGVIMKYVAVFLALLLTDVLWALYIRWSSQGLAVRAGLASVFVWIAGAFTFLEFTRDITVIIPASAGAFAGTYFTIKLDKRN